jgi:class 3 adenylate cyclase/tetratricopeptide (TPR) repeat protein
VKRERVERRLAAILAADVAGYSRLMGADEEGTLRRLKALRGELLDPKIAEHHGRIVKTTGDGLLVEFASVVDAVRCAVEVQQAMPERNTGVAADNRIELRIGINLGDVIVEGDDLYGDGVNIAARIEALADAGGVFVSNTVHDQVRDRLPFVFEDRGEQQVKNIARPVRGYRAGPTLTHPIPTEQVRGPKAHDAPGSPLSRNAGEGLGAAGARRVRITGADHWATDRRAERNAFLGRPFRRLARGCFDLQDKVASSVAGVIEPALQAAETVRSAGRSTSDLTAYDLYLRAYAMFVSSARQTPEAFRLLEQAIAHDPHYGPALAWAAICCQRLLLDDRSEDRQADRAKGADFARRALEVAGDDPGVLANAAQALAYFGEDIGAMMTLVDRALALNPNYARGWQLSGLLRLHAGQPNIAIERLETALRLSPRARVGLSLAQIGASHFFARRFDEAMPKLLLAIQDDPSFPEPYRFLAACYAHTGRLDDAREVVKRLRAITSVVIPDASHYRNPEHRELFLSGLRLAMGEEG